MEEVPCRTSLAPLASPCFALRFIGVETKELLDYQGRAGIISIVQWNLCPVIFGFEKSSKKTFLGANVRFDSAALQVAEKLETMNQTSQGISYTWGDRLGYSEKASTGLARQRAWTIELAQLVVLKLVPKDVLIC